MTEYLYPTSIEEAITMLAVHDGTARVIAGGTDVMPDMRQHKLSPRCLVDITRIPGLDRITLNGEYVEVGAAVTFAAIKDSSFLNQHVHALTDAARAVGAAAIQNVATWAGNIVQAMPAADGAVVALALEAEARIVDGRGAVWRPVETLFKGPGVSAIDPRHQLISHLRFQLPSLPWGTAWQRNGRRPSLVLPTLNCAVKLCLEPDSKRIAHVVIALGPVAPHPFRARAAEAFLTGRLPTAEVFEQTASIAQSESHPRSSIMRASRDYRLAIIPSLVSAALTVAAERAG